MIRLGIEHTHCTLGYDKYALVHNETIYYFVRPLFYNLKQKNFNETKWRVSAEIDFPYFLIFTTG